MRVAALLAITAVAAALTACSGGNDNEPAASSAATTSPPGLGTTFTFSKAEGGDTIGTIRFVEVTEVPESCLLDPLPTGSRALGIRAEIANEGKLELSAPDGDLLKVNDADGFSHDAQSVIVRSDCEHTYPELSGAPAPGKAVGWAVFGSPVTNPTAIVYTPLVWAEDASLENLDAVRVDPTHVVVQLPQTIPAASASPEPTATAAPEPEPRAVPEPEPTTTIAPRPATPAAPAAGQPCDADTDTWAKAADGTQLRCAYAGAPTPRWVMSAPFIGVRTPGSPCTYDDGVAESPSGQTLVCTGERGSSTWQPGP